VAARKARAPRRGDASGARKVGHEQRQPPSRSPKHNQARTARYSVTAGRTPLGTVREVAGGFVAVTTAGAVVGTFPTLREAAAALPGGGER
jgi:hypothetical protein